MLLNEIQATNRFRDPIYGYIWLSDDEVTIIDTPIFQRLRRIQQLALTKYVFPTAEHSRFVHSLGVLQCATNIFLELLKKNKKTFLKIIKDKELIKFFKILRFGALLHDIGHLPFSHACEKALLPPGLTHEHISQYIIKNDSKIKEIIEKNDISTKVISSLLGDDVPIYKYSIIKEIISGVFDADRADYLLRDSYNCGVAYGHYDYIRYISSFQIGDDIPRLNIEDGSIQVLETFLLARHQYNMQIPYHRTRTGIDRVLEEYIKYLREEERLKKIVQKKNNKTIKVDLERFLFFDEFEFFQEIKKDYKKNNHLAKILLREEHLVPVMDKIGIEKEILRNYGEFLVKLEEKGFKENQHFIVYKKMGLKIHSLVSESEEEQNKKHIPRVIDKQGEFLGNIIELSPILKALENKPINIVRIYVFKEYQEKAFKILAEFKKHIKKVKKKF